MMAVRIVIQGATLILVTRFLGPEVYGGYISAASLAVVLGLLPNLGSGYVLMKRSSRDPGAAADVWSYAWPLTVGLGVALTVVFPFAAHPLAGDAMSLPALAVVGGVELLFSPLTLMLCFVLQSIGRVPTGQAVLTLPLLLRMLSAGACLIFTHASLIQFVLLQAAGSFVGLLAAFWVTTRFVKLGWRVRRPLRSEIRSGSSYAAMHIVAANPTEFDKIASPLLLGEHSAGVYSATSRVMNAIVMPVVGMLLAAQPRLFRHAAEPTESGQKLIGTVAILSCAWGLIGGIIMFNAAPMLPLLFGNSYADAAQLMPFVALAAPFVSLRLAAGTILVALGHPLQRLRFELAGIIALSGLLIIGSRLAGPRGMAVSLSTAECAMAVYGWILVRRAEKLM
jgi:O-antigen/teichoic acid export membrane protein